MIFAGHAADVGGAPVRRACSRVHACRAQPLWATSASSTMLVWLSFTPGRDALFVPHLFELVVQALGIGAEAADPVVVGVVGGHGAQVLGAVPYGAATT